jgi:uncharacterized protein (TIGR02302 family)
MPPTSPSADLPELADSRLKRKLGLTRLSLAWEGAWSLAWPIPALAALFGALVLLDVLPRLPGWLHASVLVAFLGAAGVVLFRLRDLSWPSSAHARRRLERGNGLAHRPLEALADTLAAGAEDPLSQALWTAHRRRLAGIVDSLSVPAPSSDLARRDPWGLRFASLLLLAIALAGGHRDAADKFVRALEPRLGSLAGAPPLLQVWVTPPAYTGMAPILLESLPTGQRLSVPTGSTLLAELQGGRGQGQLAVDHHFEKFKALDPDSQRIEATITQGSRLTVRQGRRLVGAWDIAVVGIEPPTVAFAATPQTDSDGRLRLEVEAHDQYGVAKTRAILRRLDSPNAAPLVVSLPFSGNHPTALRQASWHDLTGHPWAGLPVTIQPEAENVAGQTATGEAVSTTLPERKFTNPVARAIVAQRRLLVSDPSRRKPVAEGLATIAAAPQTYYDDLTVFLALSTARSRLMYDRSAEAVPSVLDILWETALRIEEGDRPAAERTLNEVSEELNRALSDGASQAEIERLMNQLRDAMAQYLDALRKQAERQGATAAPDNADQRVVTPQELKDMLDQMRDLSRTGSREAAQQMLAELRQLLDGIRRGQQASSMSDESERQAEEAMNQLGDIAKQQQRLLDETFRRNQQSLESTLQEPGQEGAARRPDRSGQSANQNGAGKQDGAAAATQETLRKRLGQLMQALSDMGAGIPDALGQAEQAMRDSTRALRQSDLDDAVEAQSEALARLQEGARQAQQAMGSRNGSGAGGMARGRPGQGPGRDPLGRPLQGTGGINESSVKIPTQSDVQKAREVLDELRKRSGEAERPPSERDYLQRLLRQLY